MLDDLRTSHLTQPRCTRAGQALTLGCVVLSAALLLAVAESRGDGHRVAAPPATLDALPFHVRALGTHAQGPALPADNGVENDERNGTALRRLAALARLDWPWIGKGRDRATPAG